MKGFFSSNSGILKGKGLDIRVEPSYRELFFPAKQKRLRILIFDVFFLKMLSNRPALCHRCFSLFALSQIKDLLLWSCVMTVWTPCSKLSQKLQIHQV